MPRTYEKQKKEVKRADGTEVIHKEESISADDEDTFENRDETKLNFKEDDWRY